MKDHAQHHTDQEQARKKAIDLKGNVTDIATGHPRLVRTRSLEGDFCTGIPGADNEDITRTQLRRIPIVVVSDRIAVLAARSAGHKARYTVSLGICR